MNRKRIAISSGRAGSTLVVMTAILLSAFAFGAHGLNLDPIWADELASLSYMGAFDPPYSPMQVVEILIQYSPPDVPLYFLVGSFLGPLFGWSQLSIRFISLVGGVLMIACLFRFAAEVFNRRVALLASSLMTSTAFAIAYFHEIRPYSLLMLMGIIHCLLYWRLANGSSSSRLSWLLFAASACALLYTHNFAALFIASLAIQHLLFVPMSSRWLKVSAGWGIGAALYLPYFPIVLQGFRNHQNSARAMTTAELVQSYAHVYSNGTSFLWPVFVVAIGYALWRTRDVAATRLLVIFLVFVLTLGLANQLIGFVALTRLRYFLIAWFPFVILIALGLTSLPIRRLAAAAFLIVWCAAGLQFGVSSTLIQYLGFQARARNYPPLHEYRDNLLEKTSYRDHLVGFDETGNVGKPPPFAWKSIADYYLDAQLGIDGTFLHTNLKRYRLTDDVREILRNHPHVLLAHDPSDVPLNYARTLGVIRAQYAPCAILVDNLDLRIQRYVHPVLGCGHEPAPIEYDNGIEVLDHAARYEPESDRVEVLTWWQVPEDSMLHEYNISVQFLTAELQNVRQLDRHLYDDRLPWNTIELSTVGLPKGTYNVVLILYNRMTGEKANRKDRAASIVPVLTVSIDN